MTGLQFQVHLGHNQLSIVLVGALSLVCDSHAVAQCKLHPKEVDAHIGKDKHEDDEWHGYQ